MTEDNVYTTGELADACNTTVRTVQYYDQKGLLAPSGYSEGGRRLYAEEDAARLRFILLLKDFGLKLSQIQGILESPNSSAILATLLEERRGQLEEELEEHKRIIKAIGIVQADLKTYGEMTAMSQAAMDARMNDRKALTLWRAVMIAVGLIMDVAWIGTLIYGIMTGVWWPFPIALAIVAVLGTWLVIHTGAHTTYLCPICKAEFRSKLGAFFISRHTSTTRKLTCPCCGTKDWCIERFYEQRLFIAPGQCMPGTCDCDARYESGDAR